MERLIKGKVMLPTTIVCFIIAIITGLAGFSEMFGEISGILKILFFVFLVLTVIGITLYMERGR